LIEVLIRTGSSVIMVNDRGICIDKSINENLFVKFVTTDGGTGLGLYVSKSLVEVHGGRIWAYNNTNKQGATFCFTLPLKSINPNLSSEI
jgi:signal transduction histidine kinase